MTRILDVIRLELARMLVGGECPHCQYHRAQAARVRHDLMQTHGRDLLAAEARGYLLCDDELMAGG